MATVPDALGNLTTTTYDALDRRIAVTDPRGNTTQFAYDPVGNLVQTTKYHDELIASQPANRVLPSDPVAQTRCHLHQNLISGIVAEGIVYLLEVVQIQKQQRHASLVSLRLLEPLGKAIEYHESVGQIGQGIEMGLVLNLLFLLFLPGDLLDES